MNNCLSKTVKRYRLNLLRQLIVYNFKVFFNHLKKVVEVVQIISSEEQIKYQGKLKIY